MLSISQIAWALALVGVVAAGPAQVCNKNACYSEVGDNFNKAGTEKVAGCASFMVTTVTPSPVTVTSTTTASTSAVVTQFTTSTATVTDLSTVTSTIVDLTTETDKFIRTVTADVTSTKTKEIDATLTVAKTKTIETTVKTTVPAVTKRSVASKGCPAAGVQAATVPAYAAAGCANTVAYASACSCFGVNAATTTTLPACTTTVYATVTATSTKTALRTATVTQTVDQTLTKLKTQTSTATLDTTILNTVTSTLTLTTSSTDYVSTVTSTATLTDTIVSTITASAPTSTACGAQGLQFAVYSNINGPNNPTKQDPDYAAFLAQDYQTLSPNCTGTTTAIGGISYSSSSAPNSVSVYGTCRVPSTYFVINHQGFIYAPISGTYSFTPSAADDILAVWFDSQAAYKGYTRSTDNVDLTLDENPMSFQITLKGGKYYPLRVLFGQAQGGAEFGLSVALPNGTQILGGKTRGSPFVVQSACGASGTSSFPAFGNQA